MPQLLLLLLHVCCAVDGCISQGRFSHTNRTSQGSTGGLHVASPARQGPALRPSSNA